MKNVFAAGGNDTLSTVLVAVALALVAIGVLGALHLFMKDRSRAAAAVFTVAFAGAVVAFACSTDAVLADKGERVDAFVDAAKTTYGIPLTHADGEAAYRAYHSGDGTFPVTIQGASYQLKVQDKGDGLALLVLGGEPSNG